LHRSPFAAALPYMLATAARLKWRLQGLTLGASACFLASGWCSRCVLEYILIACMHAHGALPAELSYMVVR